MMQNKEMFENATNVYRTRKYIVKQIINYKVHNEFNNVLYSQDTFYKRTYLRDRYYESRYENKIDANGKRIKTACSARKYVD